MTIIDFYRKLHQYSGSGISPLSKFYKTILSAPDVVFDTERSFPMATWQGEAFRCGDAMLIDPVDGKEYGPFKAKVIQDEREKPNG